MQYFYEIKNIGHHACLREKELLHVFRYRAYFEGNLLRFVRACAHVCAQMTQIACAVGMRNAILRNHLNVKVLSHKVVHLQLDCILMHNEPLRSRHLWLRM